MVFVTGGCVLIVEVVATRILSPFYGNTIFSVSSILGVVLAALSIGYYIGGRTADRYPDSRLFYGIIAVGGGSVMLLHILTISLLPYLSHQLSIVTGPLITSLALFLAPAILLGMLSPFAIKLQQVYAPDKGIGTIAGEMFFWSTLGSIAGSLATGFLLIPLFGVDRIILGVGCLLLGLGIIPLLSRLSSQLRYLGVLLLISALVFSTQAPVIADVIARENAAGNKIVYSADGLYEHILIYDGQYNGRPTRFFQQDRSNSGAMYLDSDDLVYDYTRYYTLYKLFKPDIRQALVIGGGAYSIPKALLQTSPDVKVDVSEIEPSLHRLAHEYFRVSQTDRLTNHTDDGRRLLAQSNKLHDLIFSDVYYSLFSIPSHFTTREFFELARSRLSQDGIFVANLIGDLSRQQPSFILSEMRTFQAAFPNSYFFATNSPNSDNRQNIMFVGYNSDKRPDLSAAANLIDNGDSAMLANLAQQQIDPARYNLTDQPILTDKYAPVEQLISPLLTRRHASDLQPSGQRMMALIQQQLSYGSRAVGAPGHQLVQDFIHAESHSLSSASLRQRWQETGEDGRHYDLQNIILRMHPDNPRRIVVGTHYDSKAKADQDPKDPNGIMPGANDSGSGVAVLLETARVLQNLSQQERQPLATGIDFVFFDGEEGLPTSGVDSGKWRPLGSEYFAGNIGTLYPNRLPESGLVVDMVCDRNLGIPQDSASLQAAPAQTKKFWQLGNQISAGIFLPANGKAIHDDHTALNKAGIPSFVVIDLKYPPYHTRQDTLDKCSSASLSTVAKTLVAYIRQL